jgi:hypothetical protein
MSGHDTPLKEGLQISAILLMVHEFAAIRKILSHLCTQTKKDQIEIVIVTVSPNGSLVETAELDAVGAWQIVEVAEMRTPESGWAAGIRRARSSVVVLCEDHSFPEPNWAEALIEAHRSDCSAVAPIMRNGNRESAISCADFLLSFLDWSFPNESGTVSSCPGHNTSYKTNVLREYDANLEEWLNPERVLHVDLASKGHRMLLTTAAATRHVNVSLVHSYLGHSFGGGRLFSGARAATWSGGRAVFYACASPIVPLLRLFRIVKYLDTAGKRKEARFWASLPWMTVGLLWHAMGEAVGYLAGSGEEMKRYMSYEMRRIDHVSSTEKALLLERNEGAHENAPRAISLIGA